MQRQSLDLIALQYGCLYDGKPSLSELLRRLAEKQLQVVPASPPLPEPPAAD
ncbi:MAG: hypothetical protein H7Y22_09885 [Gemmatimonadaceae bacterium]|nr:hypothetical protein [Gloeobacterales cyanobacterium ES-bin-141]